MPLIEYVCKNGHRFEKLFGRTENTDNVRCPECHCKAEWAPTQVGAKPVLKRGVGGFYAPNA